MKKIAATLLSAAMAASLLAGCSGGGDTSATTAAGNAQATTAATTAAAGSDGTTAAAGSESTAATETEQATAAEKTYDEHVSVTATTYYSRTHAATGDDYTDNDFWRWLMDKYNMDMELWVCADSEAAEKQRIWINSGTMPDMMNWNSPSMSEYVSYAEQGLLRPLPDDWKTRWPNLAHAVEATGAEESFTVDGVLYALPVVVYANFVQLNPDVPVPGHNSIYFRKDWAEQVGMGDMGADGTVQMSVLKEYLQKIKDAGLTDTPLGTASNYMNVMFWWGCGANRTTAAVKTDEGYVWGPGEENYVKMIATLQDWYQSGLIDPEYFNNDLAYYTQAFASGLTGALFRNGAAQNLQDQIQLFENSGFENPLGTVFEYATVRADDGVIYSDGTKNYWSVNVFNPESDDAVIERILDLTDWLCTKEGEVSKYRGIPGVQWEYAADGTINQLDGDDEMHAKYDSLTCVGINADDYTLSGFGAFDLEIVERVRRMYELRNAGVVYATPDEYTNFTGESKANYSVPATDKIAEIVVNNLDVESTWEAFKEEYRGVWQPLVDDLNAEYGS